MLYPFPLSLAATLGEFAFAPLTLYGVSVLGAVALALMLPRQTRSFPLIGGLIGAAGLGLFYLVMGQYLFGDQPNLFQTLNASEDGQFVWYYVFSTLAIVAAVRVITHTQPVFSALWFVLVILSTAGLCLVMSAYFLALAIIIIYAGAILVTYMFVIMLAQQSQSENGEEQERPYDLYAREPIFASAVGFLLLAVLLQVGFMPMEPNESAVGIDDETMIREILADRPTTAHIDRLDQMHLGDQSLVEEAKQDAAQVTNSERVGVDLFVSHPLGLELAGVILLVSLIGAVVIAKKHVYEEDEVIQRHPGAHTGPRKD